jgi:hypothetical protein
MNRAGQLTPDQACFLAARRPAEELYDLVTDPYELHNLAADPAHADTLARMQAALDQWLTEADQADYPEPEAEIRYAERLMYDRFRQNLTNWGLSAEMTDAAFLTWWADQLGVGLGDVELGPSRHVRITEGQPQP